MLPDVTIFTCTICQGFQRAAVSLAEIAGFLPGYLSCSHQQQAQSEYFVTLSRGRCESNLHQKCHQQVDQNYQSRCEIMMGNEDFVLFGVLVWYELVQESLQVRFQVLIKRSNSLNDPVCSLIRLVWHSGIGGVKSCKAECVSVVTIGL